MEMNQCYTVQSSTEDGGKPMATKGLCKVEAL